MQSLQRRRLLHWHYLLPFYSRACIRDASLTSAISRGIRKGANSLESLGTSPRNIKDDTRRSGNTRTPPQSRSELERYYEAQRPRQKRPVRNKEPWNNISFDAPPGIPYTTAGSEFLYGTFAVRAALEARRRQMYKIYVWSGEDGAADQLDDSIFKIARRNGVQIQRVAGSWDKTMLKMSGQRPHNGYVLEAAPLPKLSTKSLELMDNPDSAFTVSTLPQSAEDQIINQIFDVADSKASIPRRSGARRYPLVLWLDRITDTGNLGAIIRTACFFGVEAIIIPEHGTAPFSPITVKSSAGAAEQLPILTVKKELDFVKASKERGWKFFAAVSPNSVSKAPHTQRVWSDEVGDTLSKSPCVLMVGNEGEGLRGFLQKAADKCIGIDGPDNKLALLDSLNVSVAAALLIARFVTPHRRPKTGTSNTSDLAEPDN